MTVAVTRIIADTKIDERSDRERRRKRKSERRTNL